MKIFENRLEEIEKNKTLKREFAEFVLKQKDEYENFELKVRNSNAMISYLNKEISEYSRFDCNEIGPFIAKLISYFKDTNYVFYKAKVKTEIPFFDFDSVEVVHNTMHNELFMISKENMVMDSFTVRYNPETQVNPLCYTNIVFGNTNTVKFYDEDGCFIDIFTDMPYVKDYIDNLIEYKEYNEYLSLTQEEYQKFYDETVSSYRKYSSRKVKKLGTNPKYNKKNM